VSDPHRKTASARPEVRSVIAGIGWPGIPSDPGAHLAALLFQLERSQWLPAEQLRERQLGQLRMLLRHAKATVPYYARTLRGLDADRLDWTAFHALHTLSRKDLQAGFDVLKVCTAYAVDGVVTDRFLPDAHDLARVEPVYESLPGFTEEITGATTRESLPANALAYIRFIENYVGLPVGIVSVGPDRTQTIR